MRWRVQIYDFLPHGEESTRKCRQMPFLGGILELGGSVRILEDFLLRLVFLHVTEHLHYSIEREETNKLEWQFQFPDRQTDNTKD